MSYAGLFVGIDSGSWNTKAAAVSPAGELLASAVVRTAADIVGASERALELALTSAGAGRGDVLAIWSTGFGRHAIPFANGNRTELDAHARGVVNYVKGPLTIVDIGGQDAKIICVDAQGRRISHRMNRKCAAGTGSFLEEMALRLGVPIEGLAQLAQASTEHVELGSFCTVFTATELLGLIRQGKRPADLAKASYRSLVKRILEMDTLHDTIVGTGGVIAHHEPVRQLLGAALEKQVIVPPHPQEMGAFGVALAALASGRAAESAEETQETSA
jgi:predicted CoA-substrate-specific enzyme activase